jgi:hypothetical protein
VKRPISGFQYAEGSGPLQPAQHPIQPIRGTRFARKEISMRGVECNTTQEPSIMNTWHNDSADECVVAVYDSAANAETAIRDLDSVGFGTNHVSVIRKQLEGDPKTLSEMRLGDDSLHDAAGVAGAAGAATLIASGIGMVLMSGPLVALTGAIVGAVVGAMRGWGVHEKNLQHYEKLVEEGKTLIVVSGDPTEVARAAQLLRLTKCASVHVHARTGDDSREIDDRGRSPL